MHDQRLPIGLVIASGHLCPSNQLTLLAAEGLSRPLRASRALTRNSGCPSGFSLCAHSRGVTQEGTMAIVKMIELSSQSSESWEEATRQAVERASRSLRNIRSVWVKEFEAAVDANKVTQFRVILKISSQLEEGESVRTMEDVDLSDLG
jgi:flavin-binding protein dodecin